MEYGTIKCKKDNLKKEIINAIGEDTFNNVYEYLKKESDKNEGNILEQSYIILDLQRIFKFSDKEYILKYSTMIMNFIFMQNIY